MRFRLTDLFNWTTAIAVVLFLVFRVVAPIIETEDRVPHGIAVSRAVFFLAPVIVIGYVWIRMRVTTPRDKRTLRYAMWGAVIGAIVGAFSGLGQGFLSLRADFPSELAPSVGVLLGALPGVILGAWLGFRGAPSAP